MDSLLLLRHPQASAEGAQVEVKELRESSIITGKEQNLLKSYDLMSL